MRRESATKLHCSPCPASSYSRENLKLYKRKLRQEDCWKLKASLDYKMKLCLQKPNQSKVTEEVKPGPVMVAHICNPNNKVRQGHCTFKASNTEERKEHGRKHSVFLSRVRFWWDTLRKCAASDVLSGQTWSHSSALSALLPSKAPMNQTPWWVHSCTSNTQNAETGGSLWVWDQSMLHNELYISENYAFRPCLNEPLTKAHNNLLATLV